MRVVIVGAGILGSSVAYHLSLNRDVVITVIDEAHQGKATLAGAGIVCPWATKVRSEERRVGKECRARGARCEGKEKREERIDTGEGRSTQVHRLHLV